MNTMDELRAAVNAADDAADTFREAFDRAVDRLMESVGLTLLETTMSCTTEEIVGQLLMNFLDGAGDDPDAIFEGTFNVTQKQRLVALATHLGPDWAQALYHAAVFITKVA
jgi:hypothetical protein